jgi:cytosine/adenosine deaminase-related metal-dependent hydrolase
MKAKTFARRQVLKGAGALGVTAAMGPLRFGRASAATAADLPRGEFVIRNAAIITMDAVIPNLPRGDIHVRNGAIVAVGAKVDVPAGATVMTGDGMIALPGLIETHWHMWNTLARNLSGEDRKTGYFSLLDLGNQFSPEDNANGVRLSLCEAIESGITTVNNWSHNLLSRAHAEAELAAHRELGVRARYSYGYSRKIKKNETVPFDDIAAVQKEWSTPDKGDGLITFGIAPRGPMNNSIETCRAEWEFARKHHMGISVHVGINPKRPSGIGPLADADLLAPDVLLVHATNFTDAELAAMAKAKPWVSMSPYTEMRTGFGVTPVVKFLKAGVPVCLSVDTTVLSGNADMFAIMKVIQNIADGEQHSEFAITTHRILEMATIDGARALGLADRTGSLTPGKRADLILVRADDINMAPMTDPTRMIVQAAQPSNVDTVVVDGRILKRDGKLTGVDTKAVIAAAKSTLAKVAPK